MISQKLQIYNIQLSDYIDVSRSIGIQPPSTLNTVGKDLFSKFPYSTIYNISTLSSQSITNISTTQISRLSNKSLITSQTTTETISTNQNHENSSTTNHVSVLMTILKDRIIFSVNLYLIKSHNFKFLFLVNLNLLYL